MLMQVQIKILGSNHYTKLKYVPLEQYPNACIWVGIDLMSTHCLFNLYFVPRKINATIGRRTFVINP
jgi:hypothetical protein